MTGMCQVLFGFEILRSEDPGFTFLCQTIIVQFHYFTKERWMQKLSGILLNYYFNWTFLGYILGPWTFFGSGSSLKDFFWV